jgi:PhnB protein
MNIPKKYLPIMPYLIVNDAKAFINFMKNVFGGSDPVIVPRSENVIMHGEMRIHDAVIMFADATEEFKEKPAGMFLFVENVDKTYKTAIQNGAKILREPSDQPYGHTAGFEDTWGNQWWITEPGKM